MDQRQLPNVVKTLTSDRKRQLRSRLKDIRKLFKKQKFYDIVLISGKDSVKVPAHKLVLSASSEYFLAMFTGNMIEAKAKEVTIEEVDGVTLNTLVDFMYSGLVEINNDNFEGLLETGDLLQLNQVVTACCDYMLEQLNLSNCLGVALLAEQHSCTELYEKSFQLACENFETLYAEEEFFELDDEQLLKLLSSDDICVSSEEQVVRNLLAWIEHKQNRGQQMLRLLSHIRFEWLKPRFILENKNVMCKSFECEQLIAEWLEWHRKPSAKRTKRRKPIGKPALISLSVLSNYSLKLQVYNPVTNEWSCMDLPKPTKKKQFSYKFLHVNNKLIIAGGAIEGLFVNSVECLDLQTMKWTDLPPLPKTRTRFEMIELNGQLYIVGGAAVQKKWMRTVVKFTRSVERYNFSTSKWEEVAPLPKNFEDISHLAVLDGLLYAICSDKFALMCYNPLMNKWTHKTYKSEKSELFGFVAANGFLYTLGGRHDNSLSQTVERYDPKTDSWAMVCPLNIGRLMPYGIDFNGRLLIFAGNDGERGSSIVEEYNPNVNEWKNLDSLPFYENYLSTAFILKEHINHCLTTYIS